MRFCKNNQSEDLFTYMNREPALGTIIVDRTNSIDSFIGTVQYSQSIEIPSSTIYRKAEDTDTAVF